MKTIILIHMEKCGGTSLRHAIEPTIPKGSMYNFFADWEDHWRILTKETKEGKRYRVINGHFNYGLHEIIGIDPVYTTQLRDPVARYVSHYLHWCTHRPNNENYDYMIKNCNTMEKFLRDPISRQIDNFVARRLSENLGQEDMKPEEFEVALERLKSFSFITFLEQISSGVADRTWNFQLGVKNVKINHMNKKHFSSKMTDADLEEIAERNKYDIALYERALHMQVENKCWSE